MNDKGWFMGPYRVVPGDSLKSIGRLGRGDIIRHKTGNVAILRCPACGRTQFTTAKIHSPDEAPTLSQVIVCGSGSCKSCEATFTIINGQVQQAFRTDKVETIIPKHLRDAGVKSPPRR